MKALCSKMRKRVAQYSYEYYSQNTIHKSCVSKGKQVYCFAVRNSISNPSCPGSDLTVVPLCKHGANSYSTLGARCLVACSLAIVIRRNRQELYGTVTRVCSGRHWNCIVAMDRSSASRRNM